MKINFEDKLFSFLFLIPLIINFITIYIVAQYFPATDYNIPTIFFALIIIYYFVSRAISSFLVRELTCLHQKLIEYLRGSNINNLSGVDEEDNDDISFIVDGIERLQQKIISYNNEKLENQKIDLERKISAQVAHDIRSPLATLEMSIRVLQTISENDRVIIRGSINRIRDIANYLSAKNKPLKGEDTKKETLPELLSSCIEEIVAEKRLHFRSHLDLRIEANLDNAYGLFALVNLIEIKRVLSNLINNAVEAYDENRGLVNIELLDDGKNAKIIIRDFGKGIPKEILSKLGAPGFSFGKEKKEHSGSGLGLYHAQITVESYKGELNIESEVGCGTTVIITLPKAPLPDWFVSHISLFPSSAVMILDDDVGIHQTWNRKITANEFCEQKILIFHTSTPEDFLLWVKNDSPKFSHVLYLCDYELIGHSKNGLQLIEENKLKNAYLVTSYFEEENVRKKCKELGVKIIPKMLADLVPIEIKQNEIYDIVHIEADHHLRMYWMLSARRSCIKLLSLSNHLELEKYRSTLSKRDCHFYINQGFGEDCSTELELAQSLYQDGFKNLYLSTSHDFNILKQIKWIQCIGKYPPWEKEEINGN